MIVASNRAAAGVYADTSGPLLVAGLRELGFDCPDPVVVPDGDPVGEALRAAVAAGVDVVLTSGGTGITPTDGTPEVTRRVLDYEIPGLAEAIRAAGAPRCRPPCSPAGWPAWPAARWWSTCPARPAAPRRARRARRILDHAVDQLRGGDHR